MEFIKKLKGYTIYKKRSGRYGVKNSIGKWINGEEKTKLLLAEGLIKAAPKKAAPAPTPEVEEVTSAEA